MKFNPIIQALVALFFISMMVSCEYDFIEIATPEPPDPNDTTVDTVRFATEIEPIFESSSCTNCHTGSFFLVLTAGNAHASIMDNGAAVPLDPESSSIYTYPHPASGTHNTKYSSVDEANAIYTWIAQGALDN